MLCVSLLQAVGWSVVGSCPGHNHLLFVIERTSLCGYANGQNLVKKHFDFLFTWLSFAVPVRQIVELQQNQMINSVGSKTQSALSVVCCESGCEQEQRTRFDSETCHVPFLVIVPSFFVLRGRNEL